MKKRILSLLLALSIACSMLVVPAKAAASNAAVQASSSVTPLSGRKEPSV